MLYFCVFFFLMFYVYIFFYVLCVYFCIFYIFYKKGLCYLQPLLYLVEDVNTFELNM
jgi:hypothetical protein